MKKIALAIVAVIALSGCGSQAPGDPNRVKSETLNDYQRPSVITVEYDGRDLECITWEGSHSEVGFTCDFVKYHAEQESDFE